MYVDICRYMYTCVCKKIMRTWPSLVKHKPLKYIYIHMYIFD